MLYFPFAKINLGLSIVNKRTDGFHTIESLLHPIKLYDILEIIENQNSDQDELILSGLPLDVPPEKNIVWKTLILLRNYYDFPPLKIQLHKQIPSGSGLGGGSSDAAHTLLGINQLFKLNIDKDTLEKLALEVGSDCPFFLKQKEQYVRGRGELLENYELNPKPNKLLLVIPEFSISSQTAYRKIIAKPPQISPRKALQKPIEEWKHVLKNDFEKTTFDEFPVLSDIKEMLYQKGAVYASLSGSGSTLFGLFQEEVDLELYPKTKMYWLNL